MVEDILSKKVVVEQPKAKPVYKYDVYQCGVTQDGKIAFSNWQKCLERSNPDKISKLNNIDRTNDLYNILVNSYGLRKGVKCRVYTVKDNYSDDDYELFEKNYVLYDSDDAPRYQVLGEKGGILRTSPSSLDKDLYNNVRDVAILNRPDLPAKQRAAITVKFQNRYRFIRKSCGKDFITAFNAYLNDYSDFAKVQYRKEIARKSAATQGAEQFKTQKTIVEIRREQPRSDEINRQINLKAQLHQGKDDALGKCQATTNYQIYLLSNKILSSYRRIDRANQSLRNDEERKRIAGVTNADLQYIASTVIQRSKDDIRDDFAKYKRLGGVATSSSSVKAISNPCRLL